MDNYIERRPMFSNLKGDKMKDDYIVIYAVVPKYIYETKELTPEDKLIAERIIYLCKKEGYCWINNRTLSEMYHITIDTASKHIKKLEKFGLIKCIYDHNDKNTKRIIRLVDDIWNKYSINNRLNNLDDIVYLNKHNNKYNKNEYKDNIVPSWINKDTEIVPPSKEEIEEMETILNSFN